MLFKVLKFVGFLGLVLSGFNAFLKIFANDEQLAALAGISRNLNPNLTVIAFSLIFIALAKIIQNTNPAEQD